MANRSYDPNHLHNLTESVNDEVSFLGFLDALAGDFALERAIEENTPSSPYSQGALGWENRSVDSVLDAAQAYGNASKNGWKTDHNNVWRRCAEILLAGKFYE
jgi:hypothetical protein